MLDRSALFIKHLGTEDPEKFRAIWKEDKQMGFATPEEDWVKIPLPYYAPNPSLPPIPTPEDVESAQTLEYTSGDRAEYAVGHVYRVNTVYAVKFSPHKALLQEAENLLFLQDHEVRSPKFYAVFSHQGADPLGLTTRKRRPLPRSKLPKYYYLVMDFVDGVALDDDDMWEDLSVEARTKIYDKIGEQLKLLRSIPPPHPTYYGRINNQPYNPNQPMINYRRRCPVGPFNSYEAFLKQAWNTLEAAFLHSLEHWPDIEAEHQHFAANFFECFEYKNSPESAKPKLSHMDLKVENMMLVPSASNRSGPIEDYDLWLLDWETLAWLPAWAEAAGTMRRLPMSKTEQRWLPQSRVSSGIKPFFHAQAYFYAECAQAFGSGF